MAAGPIGFDEAVARLPGAEALLGTETLALDGAAGRGNEEEGQKDAGQSHVTADVSPPGSRLQRRVAGIVKRGTRLEVL